MLISLSSSTEERARVRSRNIYPQTFHPLTLVLSPSKRRGNHQRKPRLDRAVRLAAFFQVALVIFFRAPELWSRLDLRYDRAIEFAALVYFLSRCFGRGFLFRRMVKDHRAILR